MNNANGPSSLHSPFCAPGLGEMVALASAAVVAIVARIEEAVPVGESIDGGTDRNTVVKGSSGDDVDRPTEIEKS